MEGLVPQVLDGVGDRLPPFPLRLAGVLAELRADHDRWRRRVESMRSEAVDRDLLDEEARKMLDRVGKDDVVIFVPTTKTN